MFQRALHLTARGALALAVAGTTLVAVGNSAAHAAPEGTRTAYALNGSGYGTRVIGGDVPAGSDTTSFQAIGCTNRAGKAHENHVAHATLPGAGEAYGVATDVWTTAAKGVTAAHTRSTVERLVVGDATTGTLEVRAISSRATARHGDRIFRAVTNTRIGQMIWTDPAGQQQEVEIPSPGESVTVPGVATVSIGASKRRESDRRAYAVSDALVIDMLLTGTRVKVAHATAEISDDVKHGLFNGRAYAAHATALDDHVSTGYQPLLLMPCQGTFGEVRRKQLARLDIGEDIVVSGLTSREMADQTKTKAFGYARGRVAMVEISDRVTAENIVGQVDVVRTADGDLERSMKGTRVGTITIDGEEQEFPVDDTIEVPGLLRLERDVVTKLKNGLEVVALRITMLDGSGAVVELGNARMKIKPA